MDEYKSITELLEKNPGAKGKALASLLEDWMQLYEYFPALDFFREYYFLFLVKGNTLHFSKLNQYQKKHLLIIAFHNFISNYGNERSGYYIIETCLDNPIIKGILSSKEISTFEKHIIVQISSWISELDSFLIYLYDSYKRNKDIKKPLKVKPFSIKNIETVGEIIYALFQFFAFFNYFHNLENHDHVSEIQIIPNERLFDRVVRSENFKLLFYNLLIRGIQISKTNKNEDLFAEQLYNILQIQFSEDKREQTYHYYLVSYLGYEFWNGLLEYFNFLAYDSQKDIFKRAEAAVEEKRKFLSAENYLSITQSEASVESPMQNELEQLIKKYEKVTFWEMAGWGDPIKKNNEFLLSVDNLIHHLTEYREISFLLRYLIEKYFQSQVVGNQIHHKVAPLYIIEVYLKLIGAFFKELFIIREGDTSFLKSRKSDKTYFLEPLQRTDYFSYYEIRYEALMDGIENAKSTANEFNKVIFKAFQAFNDASNFFLNLISLGKSYNALLATLSDHDRVANDLKDYLEQSIWKNLINDRYAEYTLNPVGGGDKQIKEKTRINDRIEIALKIKITVIYIELHNISYHSLGTIYFEFTDIAPGTLYKISIGEFRVLRNKVALLNIQKKLWGPTEILQLLFFTIELSGYFSIFFTGGFSALLVTLLEDKLVIEPLAAKIDSKVPWLGTLMSIKVGNPAGSRVQGRNMAKKLAGEVDDMRALAKGFERGTDGIVSGNVLPSVTGNPSARGTPPRATFTPAEGRATLRPPQSSSPPSTSRSIDRQKKPTKSDTVRLETVFDGKRPVKYNGYKSWRSDVYIGTSTKYYRKNVSKLIDKDSNHPLRKLLGKNRMLQSPSKNAKLDEKLMHPEWVEMGHVRSKNAGGEEIIFLQTSYHNQRMGHDFERTGHVLAEELLDIGGIAVHPLSAWEWVERGILDKSVYENARKIQIAK